MTNEPVVGEKARIECDRFIERLLRVLEERDFGPIDWRDDVGARVFIDAIKSAWHRGWP